MTEVVASGLLLCLHWLPALALLGNGVWGLVPGFVTSGLSKPHLLSRGWLWGCGTAVGHQMASCSQELKPWGFLSTKLVSCTTWDTQGPEPRLPQPVSYSVSWGLHPPSSCAHPAFSLIPKRRGANQRVENPVTLSQSPMRWTLGGPAEPHSTISGEPMDAP